MINSFVEFLKRWKARLLASLGAIAALLQMLQPKWLVDIFGPGSEGWVNVLLVVGLFLLNQFISSTNANKEENDA